MKHKLAKVFCLIIVLALVGSLFTGCKKDSDGDGGSKSGKPAKLTLLVRDNYPGVEFFPDSIRYMEERTNTELTFIRAIAADLDDRVNTLLAGGEKLDIVQWHNGPILKTLVESGQLAPLNDLIEQYGPNLKANWPEAAWKAATQSDGNIYHVPYLANPTAHFTMVYRKDWLDNLGLEIPNTIEEYYDVAVAMAKDDPDGNGQDDTYAFGACNGFADVRYFDHIFGAYGVLPQHWYENENGEIVNGTVEPGAKEALKFIKRLFDAGALDPEFVTDDLQRCDLKYQQGKYGAANTYVQSFEPAWGYYKTMRQHYPDGEFVQGNNLTSDYTSKPLGQRMLPMAGWLQTGIVASSKNKEAAMRLFDWYASDEGAYFYCYGLPGEDYNVDDSGRVIRVERSTEENQRRSVGQIWLICRDLIAANDPGFVAAAQKTMATAVPNAADGIIVPEMEEYEADLNTFFLEQYAQMAVGQIPIDGGFENFVREWNNRGGEQLTAAIRAAAAARK